MLNGWKILFFAFLFLSKVVAQDFGAYFEISDSTNASFVNATSYIQIYNKDYYVANDTTPDWHSVIAFSFQEIGAIVIDVTELVPTTLPQQCFVAYSNNSSNTTSTESLVDNYCISKKNNNTCEACIPGFSLKKDICEPCIGGYSKSNYGIEQCTPCDIGWSTLGLIGQAYCWQCSPGSSTMGLLGQSSCTLCALNSQATEMGSQGCMCLPGTTLNGNKSLCISCEPGYYDPYFNEIQREIPGSGFPNSNKQYCVACAPGKISDIQRASECSPCLPGKFSSMYGQSQCISCPVHTFSNSLQASKCDLCPHGGYTLYSGSVSCMCPAGTVNNNNNNDNATDCLPCYEGKYQPYNESLILLPLYIKCLDCQPGTYNAHVGSSACIDCPMGTYQPMPGSSQCQECGPLFYTYQIKSASSQDCKCVAGTMAKNKSTCVPCPTAYYQNIPDSTDCLACPLYTTSLVEGSVTCDYCVPGSIVSNLENQKCVLCRPGFYQPSIGQVKCLQCPSGSFSGYEGATECTLCVANSYASFDGSSECLPCPIFTETAGVLGSTRCSCALGYVASVTDTCVPCLSGYFQLDHGGMCRACAAGTYTPNPASYGPLACLLCEIGTFASTSGQSSCSFCGPNSENFQRGSVVCFCVMGTGLELNDCLPCAPGYYQPSHSLYCIACPAGYFNNQTKSSNCSQCAVGMYSDSPKSVECLDCKGGSVANLNQTKCICPGFQVYNQSYTSSSTINLWKCSPCTPHCKYGEEFMTQECTFNQDIVCQTCRKECPTGKYITSNCTAAQDTGCTSCSVGCKVGSFMSVPCTKTNNMICSQCTQACPTSRFAILSICTFGKDLTCVLCPPGTYSPKNDGTIGGCVQCPPGSITVNVTTGIDENSCIQCAAGMYSNPNQTQCLNSCLPSTYPNSKQSCALCPPFTTGDGSGCMADMDTSDNVYNNNDETNIKICTPDFKS